MNCLNLDKSTLNKYDNSSFIRSNYNYMCQLAKELSKQCTTIHPQTIIKSYSVYFDDNKMIVKTELTFKVVIDIEESKIEYNDNTIWLMLKLSWNLKDNTFCLKYREDDFFDIKVEALDNQGYLFHYDKLKESDLFNHALGVRLYNEKER